MFIKMSEEETSLKWCKLNKNSLKVFLSERYGKKISERMLIFLESSLSSFFRIDFKGFVKLIRDFVKGGPALHLRFCFASLNISGNGKLCEHDLFTMLE
jgi:hypothetical protein